MKYRLAALTIGIMFAQSVHLMAGDVANAARSGNIDALTRLLNSGAPVDEPGAANPLHFAIMSGHDDAVRILLEHGADINADSALGTPLNVAASRNRTSAATMLLSRGADPNAPGGRQERTPLHSAAFAGAAEVVQVLLDHGADPLARTKFGAPPLHLAVLKGHVASADILWPVTTWTPPKPPSDANILSADIEKGRTETELCQICHPLEFGEVAKGPSLWNVVGRPVADVEGFSYSHAMRTHGGTWDIATLDAFLADPRMAMPGNVMAAENDRIEVTDQETRWAIIAFLTTLR